LVCRWRKGWPTRKSAYDRSLPERRIRTWLTSFSAALNQVPVLSVYPEEYELSVQRMNQWVVSAHRQLFRLQERFAFAHEANSEVLSRLL
jgi:hypothetical protein